MGKVVKKIKKAVKKVTRKITKPVEKLAKGALGGGAPVPQVVETQAPATAALVDVPDVEKVESEDEAQTEAGRKKAARGGKKSLSVARSAGGGLNI